MGRKHRGGGLARAWLGLTARVPRLTGVNAPFERSLVLKDVLATQGDPVSGNRTIIGMVFNGDGRRKLLETLDVRARGVGFVFDQLFSKIGKEEDVSYLSQA